MESVVFLALFEKVESIWQYVLRYFEVFDITKFVIFETSQKSKSTKKLFCCHNYLNNFLFCSFSKNTFFWVFKIVLFEVVYLELTNNKLFVYFFFKH